MSYILRISSYGLQVHGLSLAGGFLRGGVTVGRSGGDPVAQVGDAVTLDDLRSIERDPRLIPSKNGTPSPSTTGIRLIWSSSSRQASRHCRTVSGVAMPLCLSPAASLAWATAL